MLIIVFDALAAYNMSLYGYPRETTPNIARLARRAVVYHNHVAAGDWTTPGTASLLTGTYPWTHRALRSESGIAIPFLNRTIFDAFPDYFRIAYTHNPLVQLIFDQLKLGIDELVQRQRLLIPTTETLLSGSFAGDQDIATVSTSRATDLSDDGLAYSLLFSRVLEALPEIPAMRRLGPLFPRGVPGMRSIGHFLLEDAVEWLTNQLARVAEPFLGYFHFLPPHDPYSTRLEFFNAFKGDAYRPVEKPLDLFAQGGILDALQQRRQYDEFILYVDHEFGRLYDALERSGSLSNTWLVLTSDHGETFERGLLRHSTTSLYEPVIRVPLLIFEPGRTQPLDIYQPTSAVDVLPTLAQVTGHPFGDWVEGSVLPPFALSPAAPAGDILAIQASSTMRQAPITHGSVILERENFKLHYYFGYPRLAGNDLVNLYDIRADPEELVNLVHTHAATADELLHEVKTSLAEANKPYA